MCVHAAAAAVAAVAAAAVTATAVAFDHARTRQHQNMHNRPKDAMACVIFQNKRIAQSSRNNVVRTRTLSNLRFVSMRGHTDEVGRHGVLHMHWRAVITSYCVFNVRVVCNGGVHS